MLDRKSAPQFVEIVTSNLPSPEITTLNNGVPLIQFDKVNQEVLRIELIFKAGKWYEPKVGISYFTSHLLDKGTRNNSSIQIAEIFDQFGSSVEINAGSDFVSISLFTLTNNVNKVLPLFCEIAHYPSFPDSEFALLKDIFRQNLKINNEKSSYLASKTIRQNIFGSNHPYGSSVTERDLDLLTRQDLLDFFQTRFNLHEVYVTGKMDSSIKKMLANNLSEFPITNQPQVQLVFSEFSQVNTQHIQKPESIQSSIRLGKRVVNRSNPDYPALVLLNHILGGYFGSRLMKNIREEKGLTYGINSSIHALKNDAFLLIGTDVNKENRTVALSEIKSEIMRLGEENIDRAELETAKHHLLGSLQLETANPFSVLEKIKTIRLHNLNSDFYSILFEGIQASNSDTLTRVAQANLNENSFCELSVG
ncbi:MAG: pitrilysin family protein [Cytophagales bacterium]|nr:pitrilysin family protein [Cytophagales bacterium]